MYLLGQILDERGCALILAKRWRLGLSYLCLLCLLAEMEAQAQARAKDDSFREEMVRIPLPPSAPDHAQGLSLQATVYRPTGRGPFPLVVMNHGKASMPPARQPRARFQAFSREFVDRGYVVVIPMRQGFAGSLGGYAPSGCDVGLGAQRQASDVALVVKYFQALPWVQPGQVIVAGQSHGGLITIAFGEQAPQGVRLLINFAGGLRSTEGLCKELWRDQNVVAFAKFGEHTNLPSLWFYGQNDSYFDPPLAAKMFAAFSSSQSRHVVDSPHRPRTHSTTQARLVAYPSFGQDAHGMVEYSGGVKVWWPEVERELKALGLPTHKIDGRR
jgi:dienelactone hydrolase